MTPEGDQISLYFSNRLWLRVHLLDAHVLTDSGETVSGKDSGESVGSSVGLRVWMARSTTLTKSVFVTSGLNHVTALRAVLCYSMPSARHARDIYSATGPCMTATCTLFLHGQVNLQALRSQRRVEACYGAQGLPHISKNVCAGTCCFFEHALFFFNMLDFFEHAFFCLQQFQHAGFSTTIFQHAFFYSFNMPFFATAI
jgi:hypothetical protein